jgi:hypothetical protein
MNVDLESLKDFLAAILVSGIALALAVFTTCVFVIFSVCYLITHALDRSKP